MNDRTTRTRAGGTSTTAPPELTVRDVTVRFAGLTALDGVSFTVAPGSVHALIGPNGAGKSTCFNVLSGLCRPDAGAVTLGGTELTRLEQREHLARAREIAELTGLGNHFDAPVGLLSYGDRKRVELARALCLEPRVLLLDEPVAGMNAAERARTAEVVAQLRAELGLSVVLVEHDMGLVMRLADEVTVLDFGRPIAHGTPDEIRRDPEVLRAYLGTDATGEDAA